MVPSRSVEILNLTFDLYCDFVGMRKGIWLNLSFVVWNWWHRAISRRSAAVFYFTGP